LAYERRGEERSPVESEGKDKVSGRVSIEYTKGIEKVHEMKIEKARE
jgi:hypothetical protein